MTQMTDTPHWRPSDTLAARLVLVRRELGLSQRAAAERAGIGFGTWQGMEDGRSPHRMLEVMQKIATNLNVDRDWLMWGGSLAAGDDAEGSGSPTTRRNLADSVDLLVAA